MGSFSLNEDGLIVEANGNFLQPEITIDPTATALNISHSGRVSGLLPEQTDRTEFSDIQISSFVNPGGLRSIGDNLFQQTEVSGDPITGDPGEEGLGRLQQGFLESSNVELVREMVDMIQTQRAYEINSQVIQTSNEMMQTIGQLRR